MTIAADTRIVSEKALGAFGAAVLIKVGVAESEAREIIDNLIQADLRDVESHGVVRLPIYVKRLAVRAINPRPKIRIVRETATSAVVDGDNGMGQLVGLRAMRIAIEKGNQGGGMCAFVSVRNSNHYGAAASFAQMACAHDMIGFSYTIGGINHMVPWGGAEARLGNNPFAIAIPAGEERPVVLDMACSVAARGKIIVAAKEGTAIPPDWAVGPDGQPTTDAVEALKGFVQPVGGPKGYALTLTIGLLSSMLSGAAFGSEVTHMYDDLERPRISAISSAYCRFTCSRISRCSGNVWIKPSPRCAMPGARPVSRGSTCLASAKTSALPSAAGTVSRSASAC